LREDTFSAVRWIVFAAKKTGNIAIGLARLFPPPSKVQPDFRRGSLHPGISLLLNLSSFREDAPSKDLANEDIPVKVISTMSTQAEKKILQEVERIRKGSSV
jgi:hypothetical protein